MAKKEIEPYVEVAAETMLGDLMECVIMNCRELPRPWQSMSETEQEVFINRIRLQCSSATRQAINIIAARGNVTIAATVESVTFKDGIKAVLKVNADCEGRHDLADAEGQLVLLAVSKASDLLEEHDLPQAEPNQKSIPL